jgi:2',3'-cyclic-nucleotide 2'-phosphodiesterase (5'-nucleotidase family)
VRTTESNFGNLITDASRAFTGADVAIMNGGGIRTDQMYGPGQLTRRDIQAVLPFGNVVITVELSGADLVAALENGVSEVEKTAGRFPQISGATYKYDPSAAAGSRILEVTVGGQPLDPAKMYVVAINDFIGGGGDGYEVFVNAPRLLNEAGGPLLSNTVMDYVLQQGTVSPAVEGRITTP